MAPVSMDEWIGISWAVVSALVVALGVIVLAGPGGEGADRLFGWLPGWGVLRNPDPEVGGAESFRPLLRSVVPMIVVFFVIPGFVYGRIVGTMKNDVDVIDAMADAMRSMGLYIVLVFFAAQFVAFFGYSGLGQILAVKGADLLVRMNLDNPAVFLPFILMCCFVNLMLGSASAQWAVTAPIFVPMLMTIGYSPEVIQAAYRIGDSTTNIITPMMSYFGLILAVATRYQRDLGIGTMVATMLPYSIALLVGWTLLFYLWVFVLGLPVGPDAPTTYEAPAAAIGGVQRHAWRLMDTQRPPQHLHRPRPALRIRMRAGRSVRDTRHDTDERLHRTPARPHGRRCLRRDGGSPSGARPEPGRLCHLLHLGR